MGLTFKLDFERKGFLCSNCYIMRVSVTSCHILAMFFYLLVWWKPMAQLKRWKKYVFPAPAGIWFLPTAVLLYTSMKSGNRPSQINHTGWRFLQTVFTRLTGGWRAKREHHIGKLSDRVMCSCLCALMPFPISSMTLSSHFMARKSPDTCRRGNNIFQWSPLNRKMRGC